MSLIFSNDLIEVLKTELSQTEDSVQIISAFCKENTLSELNKMISPSVKSKELIVRFRLDDIISGVTDFELYDWCVENNWKLYVHFDLHAKTYIFDNLRCIVGSANATGKGLGFSRNNNIEVSSLLKLEEDDISKIKMLFENSTLLDEKLYASMAEQLRECKLKPTNNLVWNLEIMNNVKKQITPLFPQEFPKTELISFESANDFLETFGLTEANIGVYFKNSNPYIWLKKSLQENNSELYFGKLSELLHNAMIQDPKPYRKDIKEYLHFLLSWCEQLAQDEIIIDKPNYSQRVRLNSLY